MKNSLEVAANNIRVNCLKMTSKGGSSHIGSCLSCVDILTFLYSSFLNIKPNTTASVDRDIFIMSKGHAGAAVYATLAEFGFIDRDMLGMHYMDGSLMSGHVSHYGLNGVEFSTGSLGHGLGVAAGSAFSQKYLDKNKAKTVCLLSDGELDEGSNWEAFLFSAHYKLDNLIAFVDRNRLQSLEDTETTIALDPLDEKLRSFGWKVIEIDGHNFSEFRALKDKITNANQPTCVVCNTIKGKGISFMENSVLWHYRSAQGDEFNNALKELTLLGENFS